MDEYDIQRLVNFLCRLKLNQNQSKLIFKLCYSRVDNELFPNYLNVRLLTLN